MCQPREPTLAGAYPGGGRWDRSPPPPLSKCIINVFVKSFLTHDLSLTSIFCEIHVLKFMTLS